MTTRIVRSTLRATNRPTTAVDQVTARQERLKAHLDTALAHISDYAIVLIGDDRRIAGWNRGAERMIGHDSSHAIGQPFEILYTPEDRAQQIPAHELEIAERQSETSGDRWHLRRDGSRFFGSGIVAAVRDDTGLRLGFVKIFRDSTEIHRAQEQLAASEERYRLLVESIKDYAIFMLDAEGRVSHWTTAAERIKGYEAGEIIGQPYATFFTATDRQHGEPERELQTAREVGRAERCGWRVRKDGTQFWAEEIVTAVYGASGTLAGYSKITRDITERRRAELERERLLQHATESNRLRDEFISTVSHELRTPLNAILGWTQLIRLRPPTVESLTEGFSVVERNARTQARLIEDLLDVSRIVSGRTRLTLESLSLATPLRAAVETIRPVAQQKELTLEVRHHLADDVLVGDGARLQQILWNLLSNAVKFTPSGGTIVVSTTASAEAIEVSVQDSGVGIDPDFLPFAFDRFRQSDIGHTKAHGGLGLGLSIVRHLVEMHGGCVTLDSAGRAQGTTARIILPRTRGVLTPSKGPATGHEPASTPLLTDLAVVVVDDDDDARRLLELVLTAVGAGVTVAASTADALAALHNWPTDIVLTDLALPAQDGFALLNQLRTDSDPAIRRLPVVALTAHARPEDREQCLAAGFDDYLPKPVDMTRLIDVVANLATRR